MDNLNAIQMPAVNYLALRLVRLQRSETWPIRAAASLSFCSKAAAGSTSPVRLRRICCRVEGENRADIASEGNSNLDVSSMDQTRADIAAGLKNIEITNNAHTHNHGKRPVFSGIALLAPVVYLADSLPLEFFDFTPRAFPLTREICSSPSSCACPHGMEPDKSAKKFGCWFVPATSSSSFGGSIRLFAFSPCLRFSRAIKEPSFSRCVRSRGWMLHRRGSAIARKARFMAALMSDWTTAGCNFRGPDWQSARKWE